MFSQPPPLYTHYQPPPQPMHPLPQAQQPQQPLSQYQQPFGPSSSSSMTAPPPPSAFVGQPPAAGACAGTNGAQMGPGANGMGVGSGAGDFELFGPSPPRHSQQTRSQQLPLYREPLQPAPRQQRTQQGQRGAYAIPIPSSSSSESSQDDTDYPPLPELVADDGSAPSPAASFSPPSPKFMSPIRPALLKELGATGGGQAGFSGLNGYGVGYKGERASSVPIPEAPRPLRRKTQESRDWPSFYSSGSSSSSSSQASVGQGAPPNAGYLGAPFAAQNYTDEPASFVTPTGPTTNPFDAADLVLSPAQQVPFAHDPHPTPPYTDHPLLPSEQSDLLDRVRRDLLDVDLSSIKGPLRALALSGSDRDLTPTPGVPSYGSPAQQPPPLPHHHPQQLTPKSALLRSPAQEDALSAGTVSPQEAFLDYNEVDSRLHDPSDPLFSGGSGRSTEFGVGVGGSLFAPLPQATASAMAGTVSPTPSYRAHSPHLVPHTPAMATSSPLARDRSSTPPGVSSPRHGARRGPHPFSVPQNAVTWAERRSLSGHRLVGGVVDGDADDDDGDFGNECEASQMEREEEEAEKRRLEAVRRDKGLRDGFGRFDEGDVDISKPEGAEMSEQEMWRYGLKSEVKDEEDDAGRSSFNASGASRVPASSTFAPSLPPLPQHPSQQTFAAPRPSSASSTASSVASGFSAFQHELAKQRQGSHGFAPPASLAIGGGEGGTSTPRRTAAASALAGLNAFAGRYAEQQQEQARAPAAGDDQQQSPVRPQRKRKPSQMARAAYGLVSDEDAEGDAPGEPDDVAFAPPAAAPASSAATTVSSDADGDVGGESDASYHSSQSSYQAAPARRRGTPSGSSAPPNKRRRRNPAASTSRGGSGGGGSGGGAGSGSIRCDHVNADGSTCGVIFRRPYDLARHKETIHGEGLKGEKVRVKEWKCEQCGGTFSRKDALLRHGRIRGHKTGR